MQPKTAMIFAAGFGTRMRHLTQSIPKPLVPVLGKPMIDHTLGILSDAGIQSVFTNTHYFAEQLEVHILAHPTVRCIREEPQILETGGGLKNALPLIGDDPVYTLNCDTVWFGENPVVQLKNLWNPEKMDGLLLFVKMANAHGYMGAGDFLLSAGNKVIQKGGKPEAPYVYTGVQILKTELLNTIESNCFSIKLIWDKMIAADRLYGAVYDGEWADVGHPEGIEIAERIAADV